VRSWANYSAATGSAFVVMFVVTSVGFAQVDGWANHAGLFQRLTLTIGWAWTTLIAVYMLRTPDEEPTKDAWPKGPGTTSNPIRKAQ
jgi:hypothetical protein